MLRNGLLAAIVAVSLAGSASAQTFSNGRFSAYAFGPSFGWGVGSTWGYGPTLRPWYGYQFGPGFGWGNPWFVPFASSTGYWWPGLWYANAQAVPVGPSPGAFSKSGGYGIGGGLYGAQRDLPVLVPKAPPRFATRDVKRHFEAVIENPQIAIDRHLHTRELFSPYLYGRSPLAPVDPNTLRVLIHCPPDAKVWIDGRPTSASGTDRMFVSPSLRPSCVHSFCVTVCRNGQMETRWDNGQPGELITMRFE